MTIIEELEKACKETTDIALGVLRKSQMGFDFSGTAHDHHVAYTRTNSSGTVSQIKQKGSAPAAAKTGHDHVTPPPSVKQEVATMKTKRQEIKERAESLRKRPKADLIADVKRQYRVIDTNGMDKHSAVNYLLESQYGKKTLQEHYYSTEPKSTKTVNKMDAAPAKQELEHGDFVKVKGQSQYAHVVKPEGRKEARIRYEDAYGSTELDQSQIAEHHKTGSEKHNALLKQNNPHGMKRGDWAKDSIGNHYKIVRDVSPVGDTTVLHKDDAMKGSGTGMSRNTKYLTPAAAPADYVPKQKKTKPAEPTIADKKAVAQAQGMIEGNTVSIKSGFGEGKGFRIKNVNLMNGTVTGEITANASFYPVTLRYDEVDLVPKKQTPHNVLERAGMKHKPGEGYKPELDPYQRHEGSTTHPDIQPQLTNAGYRYTSKNYDGSHTYERSVPYAHDRITLHEEDGKITRATRFSGPVRD